MSDSRNDVNSCAELPCESERFERPRRDYSEEPDCNELMRGRPVLYVGTLWIGFLRGFLVPRTCHPTETEFQDRPRAKSMSHHSSPNLSTPALVSSSNPVPEDKSLEPLRRKKVAKHSPLRDLVVQVRGATSSVAEQVRLLREDIGDLLRDGQTSTSEKILIMRQEDAVRYRIAAMTGSGLVGYLLGLRGGRVRRLVYCTASTTAMAIICYPEDVKQINHQLLDITRKGIKLVRGGPKKAVSQVNSDSSKSSSEENIDSESLKRKLGMLNEQHKPPVPKMSGFYSSENIKELKTKEIVTSSNYSQTNFPETSSSNISSEKPIPKSSNDLSSPPNKSPKSEVDLMSSLPTNSLPYSPALPSPPQFVFEEPTADSYPESNSESPPLEDFDFAEQKSKSNLHLYSTTDTPNFKESDVVSRTVIGLDPKSISIDDTKFSFEGNFPQKVLERENGQDIVKNKTLDENQQLPLKEIGSNLFTSKYEHLMFSHEKGYEDLYSTRLE